MIFLISETVLPARKSERAKVMKSRKNKSAFTLIETLIVVGVIAIMSAMIIKLAAKFDNQAKENLVTTELAVLDTALEQFRDFEYRYRDYLNYPAGYEREFYRSLEFPPDCNGFSDNAELENEIEEALDTSVSIEGGTHDPNYSSTEVMYFFLSQVPESRKTFEKIDTSMLTNKGKNGQNRTIVINARKYPLWRVIDPWGVSIRYDYYINKDERAKFGSSVSWSERKETLRVFPVLTSAGPDKEFGTEDDITSR